MCSAAGFPFEISLGIQWLNSPLSGWTVQCRYEIIQIDFCIWHWDTMPRVIYSKMWNAAVEREWLCGRGAENPHSRSQQALAQRARASMGVTMSVWARERSCRVLPPLLSPPTPSTSFYKQAGRPWERTPTTPRQSPFIRDVITGNLVVYLFLS